jgi:brefeldin A-inhibited guanine nucleotide-exchange protein
MDQERPTVDAHPIETSGVQKDEPIPVVQSVQIPLDIQSQPTPFQTPLSENLGHRDDTQGALEPASHSQTSLTNSQAVTNEVPIAAPTEGPTADTSSPVLPKLESPVPAEGSLHTSRSSIPVIPTQVGESNGHNEPLPQTPSSTAHSHPAHKRSLTMSTGHTVSVVLISSALETILSSKEAKRSLPLRDSAQNALEMVRAGKGGDRPREIFEPLRLACETRSEKLMIASLDCISKLISYSFFAEESSAPLLPSPPPSPTLQGRRSMSGLQPNTRQPSLVDLVVHTITACHIETTPETVSLQVVKALLALVLSPTIHVHQSSLLKAVRTVYNVFLLSTDPVNQMVAQGGLTQMVHHVFTRCISGKSVESDEGVILRSSVSSETLASPAYHHTASKTEIRRLSPAPGQLASDSTHTMNVETENVLEDKSSISPEEGTAHLPARPVTSRPQLDGQGHGEEG